MSGVVLVTGNDRFAVMEKFHALRDELAATVDPVTGIDEFEGDDAEVALRAVDAARTPSMFGGERLVVVRGGVGEATVATWCDYVGAPSDSTTLLLVQVRVGTGPKGMAELVKVVKSSGGRLEEIKAPPSRDKDLAAYVAQVASDRGLKLRADAAAFIAAHLGSDSGAIASTLDQLAVAFPGTVIDRSKAETFVGGPTVTKSWDLTDAIEAGNTAAALRALDGVLVDMHPMQVQSVLIGHIRKLVTAQGLAPRTPGDLEDGMGLKGFPAKKLFGTLRRLSPAQLGAAHREVAAADMGLRGASGLDDRTVLEVLVARLCRIFAGTGRR